MNGETTGTTYDAEAARAAGVVTEEQVFADYWGFSDTIRHVLPDGKQSVVIKRMNEGARALYQKEIRSDVTISRGTGDARIKSDSSAERHSLIRSSIVGWTFYRKDAVTGKVFEREFDSKALNEFLKVADPAVIDDIEKACRKANPWLTADVTVEDIDAEIESLQQQREEIVKRDSGE